MTIASFEHEGSRAALGCGTCQVEHELSGFDIRAVDVDANGCWQRVTKRRQRGKPPPSSTTAIGLSGSSAFVGLSKSSDINAVEIVFASDRIAIDSGAAESILPEGMLPQIQLREASRAGLRYISADGGRMPNSGVKRVPTRTANGAMSSVLFQVANARPPLASVSRIVEKGTLVAFGRRGSYIENEATGQRTPIISESGTIWLSS